MTSPEEFGKYDSSKMMLETHGENALALNNDYKGGSRFFPISLFGILRELSLECTVIKLDLGLLFSSSFTQLLPEKKWKFI